MSLDTFLSPEARHKLILQEAMLNATVRVKELADRLGTHEITIRRDLDQLADQGVLERIHGGARMKNQGSVEVGFSLRANKQREAKASMARTALELVEDGDSVAFDASTTALALAPLLSGRQQVSAIVTTLDAAQALAMSHVPFYMAGGDFHAAGRSFLGPRAVENLRRVYPDKVFFSCKGFTPSRGFTDPYLPETEVKQQLIASAQLVVALIDHTKFGRVALHQFAGLDHIDVLITDQAPSTDVKDALQAADVRLMVAGSE